MSYWLKVSVQASNKYCIWYLRYSRAIIDATPYQFQLIIAHILNDMIDKLILTKVTYHDDMINLCK